MNIYLLSQTENTGYDTYDSCVVIAGNEEEAKTIIPGNFSDYRYVWCNPNDVLVEYVGEFKGNLENYPTRVICASFNAG